MATALPNGRLDPFGRFSSGSNFRSVSGRSNRGGHGAVTYQRLGLVAIEFGQQIVQVEWIGEHLQPAVGAFRPLILRSVPIKLHAVVVRVAQIKCLGNAVVAGALERYLGHDQPPQRIGQKPPVRVKNGSMVKTGGPRGGRRATFALPGIESDMVMVAAGRDEDGAGPAGG